MDPKDKAPETPVVVPATPIAPSTLPEDDFDAVFDAITSETALGTTPVEPVVPATPATPTAAAPAAPVEGGAPAAVAPETPETPATVVPPEETDWKAKFEALEAERAKAPAPAPAPAPTAAAPEPVAAPAAAPPEEIQWYRPSEEEAAVLAEHEKQWPDISKAEAIRTKQAVYNAVQYTFAQVKKQYDPVLDRFGVMADALEQQLTLNLLERDHSDYNSIRDKVAEWVETLPAFAKAGAKATMKDGTPEDVSELVAEYKKAHPVAAIATPVAPVAPKAELSAAAKKAASKLTVVDSKRTTAASAPDPNDFDSAWAEASAVK